MTARRHDRIGAKHHSINARHIIS